MANSIRVKFERFAIYNFLYHCVSSQMTEPRIVTVKARMTQGFTFTRSVQKISELLKLRANAKAHRFLESGAA
jgi:hypothetical protein